jgi:hypothetical protein
MRKNCLKSVTILVMLSMFMVAPNVASAFTLDPCMMMLLSLQEVQQQNQLLLEQNPLLLEQMMSLTQCDQPIQLEDFNQRVLHQNVTIESVYVDLTNSSEMQLHLKLDRNDPFGTARDVYVHKCMQESVGAALSTAGTLKGKIRTHAVVGLDSLDDAVLIRLSTGNSPMIPEY